jgi:hypothetical protein
MAPCGRLNPISSQTKLTSLSQVADRNQMTKVAFTPVRIYPPFLQPPNCTPTAMRQTWEEVGIDLAEQSHYTLVGQLDDREITTSLGKRLLMILSPFVFLQISPPQFGPLPEPIESTSIHWTPLSALVSQKQGVPKWTTVTVDAASRIAPKHSAILRLLVRLFIGSMQFPAILLPSDQVDQEKVNGKGNGNGKEHEHQFPFQRPSNSGVCLSE